ncbi:MAG: hypothetical protein EXQ92_05720 [Alphaproteobacteria bacterium]|nr:hypothetical protein [Alphaproteobacteria bacterium]
MSTSYIERQNLTLRTERRRLTRLTNAFCKKLENHAAADSQQLSATVDRVVVVYSK